jgi:hypothetical protein
MVPLTPELTISSFLTFHQQHLMSLPMTTFGLLSLTIDHSLPPFHIFIFDHNVDSTLPNGPHPVAQPLQTTSTITNKLFSLSNLTLILNTFSLNSPNNQYEYQVISQTQADASIENTSTAGVRHFNTST